MTQTGIDPQFTHTGPPLAAIEEIPPVDIFGMLRVVWSGKWLVIATMIITVLIAGFYAFRIASPRYVATATVAYVPPITPDVHQEAVLDDDSAFETERARLTSRTLLVDVIASLDLENDPAFNRYLVPESRYSIDTLRRDLRHVLAGTTEVAPTQDDIFEKTVENLRNAITVRPLGDAALFEVRVTSSSPHKAVLVANTLVESYVKLRRDLWHTAHHETEAWLADQVATLRDKLNAQEQKMSDVIAAAQIQNNASFDALSTQVLQAEQRHAELQADIENFVAGVTPSNAREAAILAQRQQILQAVEAELAQLRRHLTTQSAGLATLHQLEVEAAATKTVYANYLTRLQDVRVQSGLDVGANAKITPATRGHYIGPQKVLLLTVATVLGLLLGLCAVALRYGLQTGVNDTTTLRRSTGLPVIAQLTKQEMKAGRNLKRVLAADPPDAIKELCTSVIVANGGSLPKVILSTASVAGEGKGLPALLLAQLLSRAGKSVLFVAADPDDQATRKINANGSGKFLCDAEVSFTWVSHTQLNILTPDAVDDILSAAFDHIIVDAPPMTASPQVSIWARQSDTVIYHVRAQDTALKLIHRGLRALHDQHVPVAGLVLTQVSAQSATAKESGAFIAPATGGV